MYNYLTVSYTEIIGTFLYIYTSIEFGELFYMKEYY